MNRSHATALRRRWSATVWTVVAFAAAMPALAQPPAQVPDSLAVVRASYDTWAAVNIGPLANEKVLQLTPQFPSIFALGPLPADADVDAVEWDGSRDVWFSLADWAVLPGGMTVHPADVIRWNGTGYAKIFDATACGVSPGANVDAVAMLPPFFGGGTLLYLSFDTTQTFLGLTIFDEDMLLVNTNSCLSATRANLQGIDPRFDMDAISRIRRWTGGFDILDYISFDTPVQVGTVVGGPGRLFQYRVLGGSWSLAVNEPSLSPLPNGNLDAVSVGANGIFYDGFESGDAGRWSARTP